MIDMTQKQVDCFASIHGTIDKERLNLIRDNVNKGYHILKMDTFCLKVGNEQKGYNYEPSIICMMVKYKED